MQYLSTLKTILLSSLIVSSTAIPQTVGEKLPAWQYGTLDIHHINTGKGEASFFILPDGTTLLVDAGATQRPKPRVTSARPDSSRMPGEWIARYITNLPHIQPIRSIDYVILTHFHSDHIGDISPKCPYSSSGKYILTGITEVGEYLPFKKIIDRGWPDYDYPSDLLEIDMVKNYRAFLDELLQKNQTSVEGFIPGRNDQVVLINHPMRFDNFEIRNIATNGEIWTGVSNTTRKHFPELKTLHLDDYPIENMCSIAFRLSYGKFDYFNGGDITGVPDDGAPIWHDVETPVAKALAPVEVNVLNHHGYHDSENAFFLSVVQPQVHIIQVWSPSHPDIRVLQRLLSTKIYPGPRDIFATNIMAATKIVIGSNLTKLQSQQGHILVRVARNGDTYQVIILDDRIESYNVIAVHGPYQSR
ncbi:MBL fold metallo-hydrolase [candidate division KSB1 bacterium]|nr:MBL fold metallo-hydrolase [candidate division KSB1 bacterium]